MYAGDTGADVGDAGAAVRDSGDTGATVGDAGDAGAAVGDAGDAVGDAAGAVFGDVWLVNVNKLESEAAVGQAPSMYCIFEASSMQLDPMYRHR